MGCVADDGGECTCVWVGQHHQNLDPSTHHEADVVLAERLDDGWDSLLDKVAVSVAQNTAF